jgi:hypothetical protein
MGLEDIAEMPAFADYTIGLIFTAARAIVALKENVHFHHNGSSLFIELLRGRGPSGFRYLDLSHGQ